LRNSAFLLLILILGSALLAESSDSSGATTSTDTLLVLPFENASKAPGLEWISESFPEVLGPRIASGRFYLVPREDRAYAFDRAGIPLTARLTRISLYQIAEQMDVDYVVLGRYDYDGQQFRAHAQLLDMKGLHLSPELTESGPLPNMVEIQDALAWDLLHQAHMSDLPAKTSFIAASTPVRLDAFENYIRGMIDTSRPEKIKHFRDAIRVNPGYYEAMLQLGHTYYDNREYDSAASWFSRIPRSTPYGNEAAFFYGLSEYYLGDYSKSEEAFQYLSGTLPLTEVYNNFAVAAGHRGKRSEVEYLQKAVTADPSDPDYHFNLAVAYYRAGQTTAATRQLKEVLNLRPSDSEAKSLLDSISPQSTAAVTRVPLQRIKLNYDETSYKQLAMEIQKANELRLAQADSHTRAEFHLERATDFLKRGFPGEAQKEFAEAVKADSSNAAAHAGLAVCVESTDPSKAVSEARAALQLKPSADAYLVLARIHLAQNKLDAASSEVSGALGLEPSNSVALDLKRTIDERSTVKN
jgi:tetratricopeptide (TPR) repeat protein